MIRDDISNKLIHLTRDFEGLSGEQRFYEIIKSKKLLGGKTDVRGPFKCICFSETPISSIAQLIARQTSDMRYLPYGFMFSKEYLFSLGARPVIYQPEVEYETLPDEIKYRHVKFDLSGNKKIDWTWEREWRLKADFLEIHPKSTTIIVPNRNVLRSIIHDEQSKIRGAGMHRFYGPFPQTEWHFIALEDLGIDFE